MSVLDSFRISCNNTVLQAGVVVASSVEIKPSEPQLRAEIENILELIKQGQEVAMDQCKKPVRDMLRQGGYKPAGRGKPASEYLVGAARKDKFPFINNVVEINNLVSLETGLPVSLLDLDKTGPELELRYGLEDESYVFNPSGQSIDLKGLITICQTLQDGPGKALGNPVKDSMLAKTTSETKAVVGVVYSSNELHSIAELEQIMTRFECLLKDHAGAKETSTGIYH